MTDVYTFELSHGGCVTEKYFSRSGGPKELKEKYLCNDRGLRTQRVLLRSDGSISQRINYVYDDRGNLIKKEKYYSGELDNWEVYKYNSDNKLIREEAFDSEKGKTRADDYRYNEYGDVDENQEYMGEDDRPSGGTKYIYTYDANGNWINKESRSVDKVFGKTVVRMKKYKRDIAYW